MHTHQHPTVSRETTLDGNLIATVRYEDGCTIAFLAPRDTRWNGGWPTYGTSGAGWPAVEIDGARRVAFPERR